MYSFCTYFDHQYLPRGIALYKSLVEHCPSFQLWVLCLDSPCYQTLAQLAYPNLQPIALEEFEKCDDELFRAKQTRNTVEYYFTCTPSLPLHILKHNPEIDLITYLDSDLFLFANPAPLFDAIADCSIAITEHRYSLAHQDLFDSWTGRSLPEMHGRFNVGWLSFRNDANGVACLRWWRERCLEWCHVQIGNGRYADQKYLDDWPTRFEGVRVLPHKGLNVAIWNLPNYQVGTRAGKVMIDEEPLLVYHFHGLKRVRPTVYYPALHGTKLTTTIKQRIYAPYIRTLIEAHQECSRVLQGVPLLPTMEEKSSAKPSTRSVSWPRWAARQADRWLNVIGKVHSRRYFVVVNGHAL